MGYGVKKDFRQIKYEIFYTSDKTCSFFRRNEERLPKPAGALRPD